MYMPLYISSTSTVSKTNSNNYKSVKNNLTENKIVKAALCKMFIYFSIFYFNYSLKLFNNTILFLLCYFNKMVLFTVFPHVFYRIIYIF